jgi:ABC-type amino acid transport substrate-binding protein
MTDDRFVTLLRTIAEPVEPSRDYLDASFEALAGELGYRGRPQARRRQGVTWWLAAAVLLAALLASLAAAGALLIQERPRSDLLETARAAGAIDVAISREYPQVLGGDFDGYDVSVVADLSRRLGLRPQVTPADPATMLTGGPWSVALPSTRIRVDQAGRWASSQPYYYWPVSVVVPAASEADTFDDLVDRPVCAVAGTTGEAWLTSRPDATALVRANDAACLEALAAGEAAGAVTDDLGPADIIVRGDVRALGPPVTSEPRSVLVDSQRGAPTALIQEIDRAILSARDDGTLADLSRRYFGGYDLTVAPNEPQETPR